MNYREKIDEVMDQVLTEKTFNLEVIGKIKFLRDEFETSQKQLEVCNKTIEELRKDKLDITTQRDEFCIKINEFLSKEKTFLEKEKTLDKNLYELNFQRKRADEIKELFGIVFKNPRVQETIYENGIKGGYDGCNSTNNTSSKTITKTKEIE